MLGRLQIGSWLVPRPVASGNRIFRQQFRTDDSVAPLRPSRRVGKRLVRERRTAGESFRSIAKSVGFGVATVQNVLKKVS